MKKKKSGKIRIFSLEEVAERVKPVKLPDPEDIPRKKDEVIEFMRKFGVREDVIRWYVESGFLDKHLDEIKDFVKRVKSLSEGQTGAEEG